MIEFLKAYLQQTQVRDLFKAVFLLINPDKRDRRLELSVL